MIFTNMISSLFMQGSDWLGYGVILEKTTSAIPVLTGTVIKATSM